MYLHQTIAIHMLVVEYITKQRGEISFSYEFIFPWLKACEIKKAAIIALPVLEQWLNTSYGNYMFEYYYGPNPTNTAIRKNHFRTWVAQITHECTD